MQKHEHAHYYWLQPPFVIIHKNHETNSESTLGFIARIPKKCNSTEAEFKEFKPRLNLSRRSNMVSKFFKIKAGGQLKPVFGGFKTWLKFIHRLQWKS